MKTPFYCLFYSFKGGVGRTSSLMNTALYLSHQKKRVLILDFDLHAPGVDAFDVASAANAELARRIPSYNPIEIYKTFYAQRYYGGDTRAAEAAKAFSDLHIRAPKGLVELCAHWIDSQGQSELPLLKTPEQDFLKDWEDGNYEERYVYRLPPRRLGDSDILVIRAGNHDDKSTFAELLREVDAGNRLLDPGANEPLAKRILEAKSESENRYAQPEFVKMLKERIASLQPDYVLVDGRPGNDWTSTLAKTWFAECVVLCFNLNPWNLEGAVDVYNQLLTSPYHRDISNLLLLVTPIPRYARTSSLYDGQYEKIKTEMAKARNSGMRSEGGPVEVPYAEILALRDVLITDVQSDDPAIRSYQELGDLIIAGNAADLENLIKAAYTEDDPYRTQRAFSSLFRQFYQEIPLYYEYGRFLYSVTRYQEALGQFQEAWNLLSVNTDYKEPALNPYFQDTLLNLGKVKLNLIQELLYSSTTTREADEIRAQVDVLDELEEWVRSFTAYIEAERWGVLAPVYDLWGQILHYKARLVETSVAAGLNREVLIRQHLDDAIAKFEQANLRILNEIYKRNLADALIQRAMLGSIDIEVLARAIAAYRDTIQLRSDDPKSYLQRGRAFLVQALSSPTSSGNVISVKVQFQEYLPYTVPGDRLLTRSPVRVNISEEVLISAREDFSNAIRHRPHEYFAYFHRGLASLLSAGALLQTNAQLYRDRRYALMAFLQNAVSDFESTNLIEPDFSPSYFYNGLAQFMLHHFETIWDDLTGKESGSVISANTRTRQAFYRLEHFIDQQMTSVIRNYQNHTDVQILHSSSVNEADTEHPDIGVAPFAPFYFDPEDIDEILAQPFEFLWTLEYHMKFPPIVEIALGEAIQYRRNVRFTDPVANHLQFAVSELTSVQNWR